MIGKRQLSVLDAARADVVLSPEEFAAFAWEEGGVADPARWSAATYDGTLDRYTVLGFLDRRRPILSAKTRAELRDWLDRTTQSALEAATLVRQVGQVGDLRDLDGRGLLDLLIALERRGAPAGEFIAARRSITRKQLALLHVARDQVGHDEAEMSSALQRFGGVNSAADLDQRGFDLLMAIMRNRGFLPKLGETRREDFGARPGFASPAQLGLIRELWAEWSDGSDDAGLVTWLERSYRVSALRFLTAPTASKAITALKAMKRRKAEPSKVTA